MKSADFGLPCVGPPYAGPPYVGAAKAAERGLPSTPLAAHKVRPAEIFCQSR